MLQTGQKKFRVLLKESGFPTELRDSIMATVTSTFPSISVGDLRESTELCNGSNLANYLVHADVCSDQNVSNLDEYALVYQFTAGLCIDDNEAVAVAIPCDHQ